MIELLVAFVCVQNPVVVKVDRDNVEIAESCRIEIAADRIIDADNNGVIHIIKDGITIDFADQSLHGGKADQLPNAFTGIGIAIRAKNITLHNAKVSGYKVGIHAINADGLTVHDCDVSNNFHQRLKSTPKAEDGGDWLWPHANDNNEWMTNYGAGLCVEDSSNVTIHNIRARKGQNAIILDRVNDSKVYDCDCSFLSGWGLAMWRSNRNAISRNAFDFCVRGYSHGVYNRGQDSAGILMFEQCSENIIAENSATHCGDGFFGFAGKEALGEMNPRADFEWYRRRGCNDNIVHGNRFSYAAAHGLELTFSFGNRVEGNQFLGNAICGIWGGYSRDTTIRTSTFANNGDMAYGRERGGINIEHGARNSIQECTFDANRCGVALWHDDDGGLAALPWGRANGTSSESNNIMWCRFSADEVAIELRTSSHTTLHQNEIDGVTKEIDADEVSRDSLLIPNARDSGPCLLPPLAESAGANEPTQARQHFVGREHIIMTEWGPYDWESPLLQRIDRDSHQHTYRVLGKDIKIDDRAIAIEGEAKAAVEDGQIIVRGRHLTVMPYTLTVDIGDQRLRADNVLVHGGWDVWFFASAADPRTQYQAWGPGARPSFRAKSLSLQFGHQGPSDLNLSELVTKANLPKDHFGTDAATSLQFPAGKWRIRTLSDDGIRVKLDGKVIIEDWTHHAPREHTYEFTLEQPKEVDIEVEHFELDGYAVLTLDIETVQE